ncbi:hypothetical protein [Nocardia farcinica]|uniref:hypothetical protein n=1 Tax=Nocardia farcinica TaxID=37329 RepID=UPI002006A5FF|nr:hypothetical protein [Nocardia farcinica]MCZ9327574.1 hypothetical protein [Nocardia farcinica]
MRIDAGFVAVAVVSVAEAESRPDRLRGETTLFGKPPAIAYLRRDISGVRQQWHENALRGTALRLGYNLRKTIVLGPGSVNPTADLVAVVHRLRVEAVFVPGLEHFDAVVPRELVAIADVITVWPPRTFARWSSGRLPDNL